MQRSAKTRKLSGLAGIFLSSEVQQLQPLIFARPANLSAAEWDEFDLDAAEWRIAADKMKMKDAHIVPLSTQAIALLRDTHPLTGNHNMCLPATKAKTARSILAGNLSAQQSGVWATKANTPRMDSEPRPAPFYTNMASIRI